MEVIISFVGCLKKLTILYYLLSFTSLADDLARYPLNLYEAHLPEGHTVLDATRKVKKIGDYFGLTIENTDMSYNFTDYIAIYGTKAESLSFSLSNVNAFKLINKKSQGRSFEISTFFKIGSDFIHVGCGQDNILPPPHYFCHFLTINNPLIEIL